MNATKTAPVANARPKLVSLNGRRRVFKFIRRRLLLSLMRTLEIEREPMGFVLITWDSKAACTISVETKYSPVPWRLLPAFINDALNRYMTVDDAKWEITGKGFNDDDPA